jgi:hypothetical protein
MEMISRAEASDRIGQAQFGFEWIWINRLAGHDEYLIKTGPQGSASPTAVLQADEVLKAHRRSHQMAYQRSVVEEWLQQRGFTGGQFSRAAFDRAFAAQFPESVLPHVAKPGKSTEKQAVPVKRATSSRPGRERALKALNEVYSNDFPDQASEPNARLCKKVGEWLKAAGLPDVSDDTILRAAGRRK